ncbi:MAG: DUF1549 domain-containing protein, partial [Planctomycetia bacterium]|nr:DUF1549 domain-containing protein [Planctomycetia bacterium]
MNTEKTCRVSVAACLQFAIALTVLKAATAGAAEPPSFDRDIRPILRASCTHCHGEEAEIAGGVDLRLHRFMLRPGDSGEPLIVSGKPDASRLIQVIESGEMPQEGRPVPAEQLALLRQWVVAGAPGGEPEPETLPPGPYFAATEKQHWAFQPITRPTIPASDNPRIRNEVDVFIDQKLAEHGLDFAPDADRRTLIRRLTFDLTGLPPTPAEIDAFLVRREQLTATGFLRMAPDGTGDKVADVKLARNEAVAEQLKVVSSALLGLTVGCAQCHDHRFDPVSQADYYQFRAIFEPAFDWQNWRSPAARNCSLATPEDKAASAQIEQQAKAIEAEAKTLERTFLDEIFEKEILKLPEDVRDAYREARATPKNKQSPEQLALIKKYPSALALYSLDLYDKKADKQVK